MKSVVLNEYKQMILLSFFVLVLVHSTALAMITHISHMVTWLIFRLGLFLALGIFVLETMFYMCFHCICYDVCLYVVKSVQNQKRILSNMKLHCSLGELCLF